MANVKKANYILNTVGITLPDYERKNLKVGMSVTLTEKVGDKFAKRGFLTKANEAKSNSSNDKLKEENEVLAKENESLKEQNKALSNELEALKKDK